MGAAHRCSSPALWGIASRAPSAWRQGPRVPVLEGYGWGRGYAFCKGSLPSPFSPCPGFSWDGVNFPLCFGFSTRQMSITLMFSVVAINHGHFPVSRIELMSKVMRRSWEGPQPARQPSWPMEIFHTIDLTLSL